MTSTDNPATPEPASPRVPVTVLHVLRTEDPLAGGHVTYLANLRAGLAGCAVITHTDTPFSRDSRRRVLAWRQPLAFWRRITRRIPDADLIHVHGIYGWHVVLSVIAARWRGCPYIVSTHGHLYRDVQRDRPIGKPLYLALIGRAILRRAVLAIATSTAEQDVIRSHSPAVRIARITPGLPVPPVPPSRTQGPGNALRLLFLGRVDPHKGLHWLLPAIAEQRDRGLDIHLVIAGGGYPHHIEAVRQQAASLGLGDCVQLAGHVEGEHKQLLLQASNLFVLPSRSENFAFAAAEAMAAGLPVIITDNVGLAPLVTRWRCGQVVAVGDTGAIERALRHYADAETRRHDGERAHAAARRELSLEQMGKTVESAYHDLVR